MASEIVLSVDDVHTFYGSIEALKGISLEVREGEIVTLIGANGAGKSTTLRSINGLNHPRSGKIVFQGTDVTSMPPHQIVKNGISQSPEGRKLFPRMSVTENLEMGAFQRSDRAEIREDMDRVFSLLPRLAERRTQKAGTMSGGAQQTSGSGRGLRPTAFGSHTGLFIPLTSRLWASRRSSSRRSSRSCGRSTSRGRRS